MAAAAKKNVLLFIVDDLRPFLGIYNDTLARTPNIDNLGARATVFEKNYVQQSVCAPSRTSFLTSRRPDTTNVYDFDTYFRDSGGDFVTLPQYFKENDYNSKGIGKIFQSGKPSGGNDDRVSWSYGTFRPKKHGGRAKCSVNGPAEFLMFCPAPEDSYFSDVEIREKAVSYIRNRVGKEKPFFVAVGFHRPHKPQRFPAKYLDLYPYDTIPALSPENAAFPVDAPVIAHAPIQFGNHPDFPRMGTNPWKTVTDDTQRKLQQHYRFASFIVFGLS